VAFRKSDKLKALAAVPLFADLSKKELESAARFVTEGSAPEGTPIVTQGEIGREAMILMSGSAVVRRNNRKVAEIGPGAIIGEMALVDQIPRNATVVATSDVELLVMDAREFTSLISNQPKVAVKVLRTVARRYAEMNTKSL
jgi:CRP/FNR family cyclic AMP-dependent transcriptional regulator